MTYGLEKNRKKDKRGITRTYNSKYRYKIRAKLVTASVDPFSCNRKHDNMQACKKMKCTESGRYLMPHRCMQITK